MKVLFFILAYGRFQVCCNQEPQIYFSNLQGDTLSISENENISLIFWLDTSACQDPSGDYRMEVETRKGDGGIEYDGKLARWNKTCIITSRRATRCTGDYGPAELFRKINRSHTEIVLRRIWEEDKSKDLREGETVVKLNVYYHPRVTNLMINGNDVSEINEIYEGRKYNISCTFEEGNPAAFFSLINGRGDELDVTRSGGHINHVFIAERSKHDLFPVYCTAPGSEHNISAVFLMQDAARTTAVSKTAIMAIVLASSTLIISILILATVIIVRRLLATRHVAKCDTKEKSKKKMLISQIVCNIYGKDIKEILIAKMWSKESLLLRKTNEKEDKLSVHQKVSKDRQDQSLQLLLPQSTKTSELFVWTLPKHFQKRYQ